MTAKRCVAMLLAGGQGSRLGVLTEKVAKPAVPFGGKYRIIDFALSNCVNSEIDTVGVMTQYRPLELNSYIGNGQSWDLDRNSGGVYVLPPFMTGSKGEWYSGTANAIYQNIGFLDQYNPKYVLVLSGDHIYKMNYSKMLQFHEDHKADATIAVIEVPWNETSRFGILNTQEDNQIYEFEEKPKQAKSNKASMGVYVFDWKELRKILHEDAKEPESHNDFGKDIIPLMLQKQKKLYAFPFEGYWKDVGTIYSLWEANMDLIASPPRFNLYSTKWRIYSRNPIMPPHYISENARAVNSLVTEGCNVYGTVTHSVLFYNVHIGEGALIEDSVIMPNVVIGKNSVIKRAIIGENTVVGEGCMVGEVPLAGGSLHAVDNEGITVVAGDISLEDGTSVTRGDTFTGILELQKETGT
jgi:glucose-1-phosphate adenylyltransferase